MRRPVLLARAHRHGGSSAAPPASAGVPGFWAPASCASTALVVLGATPGANSCPEAPSASAAAATTAVAAAAMRYHRLTRPVTGVPLDSRPVPETPAPSADNGNRASILSRVGQRWRRRLGVGNVPKLADLFRAHYLADGVDFDSIRVHHSDTAGADGDLACRALGARAFTVGTDIYFAAGEFRPHTRDGLWLLAHEVAHVAQQCAGLVGAARPGADSALTVLPAGTAEERAADRAADALIAGRRVTFGASDLGAGVGAGGDRRPVLQRYMAWEHSMLGDLDPALVRAAADGDAGPVAGYRDLLAELGRAPRQADEKRLRAAHPAVDPVRLRGSGLVVTLGELNVLPDYLGRPEDIESAPLSFVGPLIQSVRSWSIAELARPAGVRGVLGPWPALPRPLPGSLRYPLLGPLAETAEIAAVSALGRRHGFEPATRYSAVLARNSGHFAPFSWYRWLSFHHAARELIARSAAETGTEREALRLRARTWAGYADHFLQDSFAAGHLINKTLVIQWYIEWLAASGVSYPGRDVLDALTVARQPLLHGPGYYDRAAARARALAGGTAAPGPARDAQDVADAGTPEERIAASGVVGDSDAERRAAYAAYLAMLGSGTVQLAVKVAHEYLNAHSLVVSAGPAGPRFRLNGDHTLLAGPAGALRAAEAAAASRRAIAELLRDGETAVDSWDIFDCFPDHVEHGGRLLSLPQWHREGLRPLCVELFERRSTRALRSLMSGAFGQRVLPTSDALE